MLVGNGSNFGGKKFNSAVWHNALDKNNLDIMKQWCDDQSEQELLINRGGKYIINDVDFNVVQGNLTHNNLECSQVIQDYSRMIQDYLYNKIYTYQVKDNLEPSGYLWNTFNNSIYWSNEPTFEQAIIGAVNHGGDADTIAAITGSLAGAKFGFDQIPERWIDQLNFDVKLYLKKFKNFVISYVQSQSNMV